MVEESIYCPAGLVADAERWQSLNEARVNT